MIDDAQARRERPLKSGDARRERGCVGGVGHQHDVRTSEALDQIDASQHFAQQRGVGLVNDDGAKMTHLRRECRDVVPASEATDDDRRGSRDIDLLRPGTSLRRGVAETACLTRNAPVGDSRAPAAVIVVKEVQVIGGARRVNGTHRCRTSLGEQLQVLSKQRFALGRRIGWCRASARMSRRGKPTDGPLRTWIGRWR